MRQYVLLNQLLIPHDPRLLKTCISRNVLTVNWCQTWEANTRGARFSQFALCLQWFVQGDVLQTQYTLGPRGHVIMGFATKTAVFLPLLNTFLKTLGVRLIHVIMAFCQYICFS